MTDTPDLEWDLIPARQLVPGDRTKWGYGHGMENATRTVMRVEKRGGGIVAIYYRETWDPYHAELADNYLIRTVRRSGKETR